MITFVQAAVHFLHLNNEIKAVYCVVGTFTQLIAYRVCDTDLGIGLCVGSEYQTSIFSYKWVCFSSNVSLKMEELRKSNIDCFNNEDERHPLTPNPPHPLTWMRYWKKVFYKWHDHCVQCLLCWANSSKAASGDWTWSIPSTAYNLCTAFPWLMLVVVWNFSQVTMHLSCFSIWDGIL